MTTKNFCSEYIQLNSGTEIPPTFTAWCSLSAISAAMGRRVWIDMGPFRIYPNMYIILIAGSGQLRKSTAVNVTRDLLEQLDPHLNMLSQKSTAEAMMDALKDNTFAPGAEPGKVVMCPVGQGFIVTDELTNFINPATTQGGIVPMLIEFYDCRDRFSYRTKARGLESLRNTQLGMLAATTPEELRNAIPEAVIGSGLASRILFVYESTAAPPVAFPTYTSRAIEAKEFCIRWLQRAYQMGGPVPLSAECREWGEECYKARCYNSPLFDNPHLRGYASRRFIHILKLAMVLGVGLNESPVPTVQTLERAERLLNLNESHLQRVVELVTMNDKGSVIQYVRSLIAQHKSIKRHDLMRLTSHRLDSRELTEILETLIRSNQVTTIVMGVPPIIVYSIHQP